MSDFQFGQLPERSPVPRVSSSLQQSVHEGILASLHEWLDRHPSPDSPVLSFASLGEYSPRQLYRAVAEQSETGKVVESIIVNGARRHPNGLQGVLQSFRSDGSQV
jgi:hypothetical protein